MANLVNLTPHKVTVVSKDGSVIASFLPSGVVARMSVTDEKIGEVEGIDIYKSQFGDVEDLAEVEDCTMFIVSRIVRTGNPDRSDLLSPGTLVRNAEGQPVGCLGLVSN